VKGIKVRGRIKGRKESKSGKYMLNWGIQSKICAKGEY
jgi:hypothetical protein